MSRSSAAGTARLGLAVVDPPAFSADLVEALHEARVLATFFVRAEVLVLDTVRWRFLQAAGHELGNGCLLGVTDDGRLPNWTCATLEAELRDCGNLLAELGQQEVSSVYLPGRFHVCADGRYRHKLQRAYPVCVGDTERSASLEGVAGAYDLVDVPTRLQSRSAVAKVTADLEHLRRVLAEARGAPVGPVGDLANGKPHT